MGDDEGFDAREVRDDDATEDRGSWAREREEMEREVEDVGEGIGDKGGNRDGPEEVCGG